MLQVTDATKNSYLTDCHYKRLKITIDGFDRDFENEQIVSESMKLKQSIMDGNAFELGGCISSFFEVQVHAKIPNKTNSKINAYLTDDTDAELLIFTGYIDNVTSNTSSETSTISCYDALYKYGSEDIADWYNQINIVTIKQLLVGALAEVGIGIAENIFLPCGNLPTRCGNFKEVDSLTATELVKKICELNGGFGYINNNGNFDIRYIEERTPDIEIETYRKCSFSGYFTKSVDKIVFKINGDTDGTYTKGKGKNTYYIQNNMVLYGMEIDDVKTLADILLPIVSQITFMPFDASTPGLPFLEVGDYVCFKSASASSYDMNFYVFTRQLSGIQLLVDLYDANATEMILPNQTPKSEKAESEIDQIKTEMLNAVSVDVVPEDWKPKTIYFRRKQS